MGMEVNKAIKTVWQNIKDTTTGMLDDRIMNSGSKMRQTIGMQTKEGFMKRVNPTNEDRLHSLFVNAETGEAEYLKRGGMAIAGGYMGISAAGRIASGGGLYRDSDGNFDIIGIPLI